MSFLAPSFALLAALALAPIAIHLFGRPQVERRPFAAIAFLRRGARRTASHNRLRRVLLLVVRALTIALVPLLLAKPLLQLRSHELPGGLGQVESVVLVLDDSRSMNALAEGRTLFARASDRCRAILSGLGHGSEAAILLTSHGSAPLEPELTSDRVRLERALGRARPTHLTGDTAAALARAVAILGAAKHLVRRVYLISDMAAHGFEMDLPWPPAGPALVPVPIQGAHPTANRAVLDVRAERAPELGPRGMQFTATIGNFFANAVRDLAVTLRIDGRAVAKGMVDVPAHGRTVKRFFHLFRGEAPPGAGSAAPASIHDVEVVLAGDALPDDDRRFLRVSEQPRLRVLVFDGDPRTIRRDDEAYYLEAALRAGSGAKTPLELEVAGEDQLGRRPLDAEVVFLLNLKAPDASGARALKSFVDRGGGLFLTMGARVDAEAYDAALGDLLPQALIGPRTLGATLDARSDGESLMGGGGERIARVNVRHEAVNALASGPGEAIGEARVFRFMLLRPTPEESGRQVLLRLESGAPLLLEKRAGQGAVMLLTTTIDRDWSDLAIQPGYVPLVEGVVRHLAGRGGSEPTRGGLLGEEYPLPLAAGDARVEITSPTGRVHLLGADRVLGRRTLAVDLAEEPGIYRVAAGSMGQPPAPRPAADFALNVDTSESDASPVAEARLARLETPPQADGPPIVPKRHLELWHGLALALLALLFIEGALTLRRA